MAMKVSERDLFLHSIAAALDSHAQALIEQGRLEYNTLRPHSSLNYRPPAPEAWLHGEHIF
jgi:putative transposase